MATTEEFIKHVCGLIETEHFVRYKKMFGEYLIYVNEKPIVLVCDNTVYLKNQNYLLDLLKTNNLQSPYKGAKPHFVMDLNEIEKFNLAVKLLEENTKLKPKKSRN